ncbi:MAG: precorrin-6y C5,15-methyltransferase (decarboxylating) subunit CbiE [Gemmataceae bacterium]|nr:precorrin-6y C5,15-methyltransferase (decarboxylating) subunit CbiE [Gemmataceae bacterium]
MVSKIHVIGIGSDGLMGLTGMERDFLSTAQLIVGAETALAMVDSLPGKKQKAGSDLQELVEILAKVSKEQKVALLVSGDPLFYGVVRYLCEKLGKDSFEIHPHVSSMQMAFARVKESWDDAYLTNLQNQPIEQVVERIRVSETAGIFTSPTETPRQIANRLLARGIDYFRAYVCENLGGKDERVTQGDLEEIAQLDFDPLNVMILKRKPGRPDIPSLSKAPRQFGNADDLFAQSKPKTGLLTQSEIRAIALSRMAIKASSLVWDIGAGSGSVSIEAAQLCYAGLVYAIEQDAADFHLILANAENLGVKNLKAVHGVAPDVFQGLPRPDAIFVGGIGKEVIGLLEKAFLALLPGGRMVVNVGSIENLSLAHSRLKKLNPDLEVLLVQISRGLEQYDSTRFEAVNPSYLITLVKNP